MDKLKLEVLTPGRILLETEADHVVLPGFLITEAFAGVNLIIN